MTLLKFTHAIWIPIAILLIAALLSFIVIYICHKIGNRQYRKVIIAGYTDFDFFMMGKMKYLELYEGLSGSIILRQSDMGSRRLRRCKYGILVENIPAEIKRRGGRGYLNRAVVNFICEHDQTISPRYIVKKIKSN